MNGHATDTGGATLQQPHTFGEKLADAAMHAAGISASLLAVPALLIAAIPTLSAGTSLALVIYGLAIILLFITSAAYHMIPALHWKPLLRRFDQAAIFLKIAGTYTPLVVLLGGAFAYLVLAAVWLLALGGAVAKLAFSHRFDKISFAIYLPLGWASLLLLWPIFQHMPLAVTLLILAGGLLYTLGSLFFMRERLAYQNAIWHAFVLAASGCHFLAISSASFAMA